MAYIKAEKVAIRGFSGCVPANVEENIDLPFYAPGEAEQVIEKIGIVRRHVATPDITVADMCFKAAEKLIEELGWEKDSIDLLALCTQCPDYLNQPTSFLVHDELELPESTMCMDFYHGCPGWVVSLASVCNLVSTGQIKRAILLDGDSVTKDGTPNNREERPLFGDAATATALEYSEDAKPIYFNIGTKSDDGRALIHPNGGFRNPFTMESLKYDLDRRAGKLSMEELESKMDSMDVFSFAITKVPKAMKKLCSEYDIDVDGIDKLVLHQANKLILENIAKRMKV
ncbi:MAG: ketoacyl-ACP synthase III, partial [Bacteroidaceae bacterium]|nr:ketoacyl-ACP synthase III [Bacteroidaceae bacterium]